MLRTREQLRWIHEKLKNYFNDKYKNLANISIIFDMDHPRLPPGSKERPTNILLHNVDPKNAVRMLRETADLIEKVEGQESLIVKPGPMIIPGRFKA